MPYISRRTSRPCKPDIARLELRLQVATRPVRATVYVAMSHVRSSMPDITRPTGAPIMPPTPAPPAPQTSSDPIVQLAKAAKLRANQLSFVYAVTGEDQAFAAVTAARERADQLARIAAEPGRWN